MVLRNTMGINYNTLAMLTGSKPWCLSFFFCFFVFFHLFERTLVGLFSGLPHRKKRKTKERRHKRSSFPSTIGKLYYNRKRNEQVRRVRGLSFCAEWRTTYVQFWRKHLLKIPHTLIGMHWSTLIAIVCSNSAVSVHGKSNRRSFPPQKP